MTHRTILTPRQRRALFDLPRERTILMARYVLSDRDLIAIRRRKGAANQLGFALQLCAFRWPGRLIRPGELIPEEMLAFISNQLGFDEAALAGYGTRSTTRYQHSSALQKIYGYRPFEGKARRELRAWLVVQAGESRTNVDLASRFLEKMRRKQTIVPGPAAAERLCADALVEAEKAAIATIAGRVDSRRRDRLTALLEETEDGRLSRFVWLRRFGPGGNSADMHRLLDRREMIRGLDLPDDLLDGVPRAQIDRLRQQGERLFGAGLRKLAPERRFAILGVSVMTWRDRLTDAAIETNDRILGSLWREAERHRDAAIQENRRSTTETLRGFAAFGTTLIQAHKSGTDLGAAIEADAGWKMLESLVGDATLLTARIDADPIDYICCGHARLRRYARRFLASFDWQGAESSRHLLAAIDHFVISDMSAELPIRFARPKWRSRLKIDEPPNRALWEIAVLYELRAGLRSGDVWVSQSARYQQLEKALLPAPAVKACQDIAVPFDAGAWLAGKRAEMASKIAAVNDAARYGRLANAELKNGHLELRRLTRAVPLEAEELVASLYDRMMPVKITELLLDADDRIGFTEAFTDLRNGVPPADRKELMTVLLADGINLGIKKMADACPDYSYWELLRVGTWHVRPETYHRALAMVIDAHAALPFARIWGHGDSSSSDGQHIRAGAEGEAMNVVNAKYGTQPGMSSYAHVSDQFAPFHAQRIGATAHEAPYVIDGLLLHDSGLKIKEHFTDTGGFTDHVFAVCAMLGFRFAPRIRGLADNRLYAFDPAAAPDAVRDLIARPINEKLITDGWPDMLRAAASMAARVVVPSQYLRKLAAYPRRNALARAWREVGRIERTLFTLDWLLDLTLQRRAQISLNKGEAHHALKNAIHFHRKGEIRDRTRESQELRIAGMNFLAAIIIYMNTLRLGEIVQEMISTGSPPPQDLLLHVSPLGWEHITLTGEYAWARS